MTIAERVLGQMMGDVAEGWEDSPLLILDDGRKYIKFDGIQVDRFGEFGLRVAFTWKGKPTMFMEPVYLAPGDTFNVGNIEGRTEFELTSS